MMNEKTIPDPFHMLWAESVLEEIIGKSWFTKLDAKPSYHIIKMDPADVPMMAFDTPSQQLELVGMPFGLKNAPTTFQRLMKKATFD